MKNNKFSDDYIDEMLKKYYSRNIKYDFKVKDKKRNIVTKEFPIIVVSLVAICILLVGLPLYLNNNKTPDINVTTSTSNSSRVEKENRGFSVRAYSNNYGYQNSEVEAPKNLSENKTSIGKAIYLKDMYYFFNDYGWYMGKTGNKNSCMGEPGQYEKVKYNEIIGYYIKLEIVGDDIKSFDISADSGYFSYSNYNYNFDREMGDYVSNDNIDRVIDNIGGFDYGHNQKDIKYEKDKLLFWFPDIEKLKEDINNYSDISEEEIYRNSENTNKYNMDRYYKAQDEFIEKYGFDNYITKNFIIDVHYNDGTSETVNIEVSLDDNDNCILNY